MMTTTDGTFCESANRPGGVGRPPYRRADAGRRARPRWPDGFRERAGDAVRPAHLASGPAGAWVEVADACGHAAAVRPTNARRFKSGDVELASDRSQARSSPTSFLVPLNRTILRPATSLETRSRRFFARSARKPKDASIPPFLGADKMNRSSFPGRVRDPSLPPAAPQSPRSLEASPAGRTSSSARPTSIRRPLRRRKSVDGRRRSANFWEAVAFKARRLEQRQERIQRAAVRTLRLCARCPRGGVVRARPVGGGLRTSIATMCGRNIKSARISD